MKVLSFSGMCHSRITCGSLWDVPLHQLWGQRGNVDRKEALMIIDVA